MATFIFQLKTKKMLFEKIIFYLLIALLFYPIILFYVCVLVVLYYGIKGKIDKK